MSKIITISRQFSSGGREIGKRLADELDYAYYDKELISNVAKISGLSKDFVERYSEANFTRTYPYAYGRSFATYIPSLDEQVQIAQAQALEMLSKTGNCVIIGRCADALLSESHPFKIFIHSSDIDKRIDRCYTKVPADKNKSRKEIKKMITKIDKQRAKYYSFYTTQIWGNMSNYDLCINTSTLSIKEAVEIIKTAVKNIK